LSRLRSSGRSAGALRDAFQRLLPEKRQSWTRQALVGPLVANGIIGIRFEDSRGLGEESGAASPSRSTNLSNVVPLEGDADDRPESRFPRFIREAKTSVTDQYQALPSGAGCVKAMPGAITGT
jgi:hypothetical protein